MKTELPGAQAPVETLRAEWERFYAREPERLPRRADELAGRWAPRLGAWLRQEGLPNRLLELGSGAGQDARLFLEAGVGVVAMDLSQRALEVGALHAAGGASVLADLRRALPFAAGSFGAVHSRFVLSGELDVAGVERVVAELRRVLAPGGLLLLAVRSTDDPTYHALGAPGAGPVRLAGGGLHFFSFRSLKRLLDGFAVIERRAFLPEHPDDFGWIEVAVRCPPFPGRMVEVP